MKISPAIIALTLMCFARICVGQDAVPDTPALYGILPAATFHGADVDSVNLLNGNVVIQAPIYSLPQKGKVSLSYQLQSNNPPYIWVQSVDETTGDEEQWIEVDPNANPTVPVITRTTPYWGSAGADMFYYDCNGIPDDVICADYHYYWMTATDSTGAVHRLFDDASNPSNFRAVDGSGYLFVADPISGGLFASNGTLYESNGVSHRTNPDGSGQLQSQIDKDTDGNSISANMATGDLGIPSVISLTDTLNRNIPAPPYPETSSSLLSPYPGSSGTFSVGSTSRDFENIAGSSTAACPTISGALHQPLVGSKTWTVPGPNGNPSVYTVCFAEVHANTNFWNGVTPNDNGFSGEAEFDNYEIQSIVLPGGAGYWYFIYDSVDAGATSQIGYGTVTKVGLPSGATVSYIYTPGAPQYETCGLVPVTQRTVDFGDGIPHVWHYQYNTNPTTGARETVVTDPENNQTVVDYTYSVGPIGQAASSCSQVETSRKFYQGTQSANVLLRTETTKYQASSMPTQPEFILSTPIAIFPQEVDTIESNGQTTVTTYTYDTGFSAELRLATNGEGFTDTLAGGPSTVSLGRKLSTTIKGYDGSIITQSAMTYQYQENASYYQSNLIDLPSQSTSYDGSGTQVYQATYGYDENPSPQGVFGHQTSTQKWLDTTSQLITNTYTYDSVGRLTDSYDANFNAGFSGQPGDHIHITYDDSSGIFPLTKQRSSTNGVNHIEHYVYDANTGNRTDFLDENGVETQSIYDDPLGRLTKIKRAVSTPSEAWSSFSYPSRSMNGESTTLTEVDSFSDKNTVGDGLEESKKQTDGLGRATWSQVLTGAGLIYSRTAYDDLGRKFQQWNSTTCDPAVAASCPGESTWGIATFHYDALGRLTSQIQPDGNMRQTCYNGLASTGQAICQPNQSGNDNVTWVDVADEHGNRLQQASDALGRLIAVVEPDKDSGILSVKTSYQYDSLNNLLGVSQSGVAGETPRLRSFSYDSLSRLITSQNPETGTICYGTSNIQFIQADAVQSPGHQHVGCQSAYDANGNLITKTDANGMVITYTYDALNRLTHKYAPDNNTDFEFVYDNSSNGIGRLAYELGSNSEGTLYSYDAVGHILNTQRYDESSGLWGLGMSMLQYDLAGNLTHLTYPDNRTLAQAYDVANRLAAVIDITDTSNPVTYFNGAQYFPSGSLQSATYGNNVTSTLGLNNRLQPCSEQAALVNTQGSLSSSVTLLNRQLYYASTPEANCGAATANNGNIAHVLEGVSLDTSQDFLYDTLNRLKTANSTNRPAATTYSQSYGYDSFGNMLLTDYVNVAPNYTIDPVTNRLLLNNTDYTYDNAGELISAPAISGYHSIAYTAEGYLRSIDDFQTGSYVYNGEGERAWAVHASLSSWNKYFYLDGQPMADLDNTGVWTDTIYANGQKIARVPSAKPLLHLHGVRDSTINMACGVEGPLSGGGGSGIIIATGDKLSFDFQQNIASGAGFALIFTDGTGTGDVTDIGTGTPLYFDSVSGPQWQLLVGSLDEFVGKTVAYNLVGIHNTMPAGTFDMYYANAIIQHVDGTSTSLYSGQPVSVYGFTDTQCGGHDLSASTDLTPVAASESTSYFLADQLGTTQTELSSSGAVLWQGAFTPFGQEIVNGVAPTYLGTQPADGTSNRYKFTGKERDTESGLDYFGARSYASGMGRFMSPDWAAKAQPVPYAKLDNPQSLNLYAYVGNNPLSNSDTDGHICISHVNDSSGFCVRAAEYSRINANPAVNSRTVFFDAAAEVSAALNNVSTNAGRLFFSSETVGVLNDIGESLLSINETNAQRIASGTFNEGSDIDHAMVVIEQTQVQTVLNALSQAHPDGYAEVISQVNSAMNSVTGRASGFFVDRDYNEVLKNVIKSLGRPLNFAIYNDRVALGNAMVEHKRKQKALTPGGCPAEFAHCN